MGMQKIDDSAFMEMATSPALTGARIARDVMLLLNCGFTSVREMAGFGLQIGRGIEEGSVVGPNIYSCNKIIVSAASIFKPRDDVNTASECHRRTCRYPQRLQAVV